MPQLTLCEIQQSCIARNLKKVLSEALKDKKAPMTIMKQNLLYKQLLDGYLNN